MDGELLFRKTAKFAVCLLASKITQDVESRVFEHVNAATPLWRSIFEQFTSDRSSSLEEYFRSVHSRSLVLQVTLTPKTPYKNGTFFDLCNVTLSREKNSDGTSRLET